MKKIVQILKKGGIGVLATDTLYGIVGSALLPQTVERVYRLRRRDPKKPMIILIGSVEDLREFDVRLSRGVIGKLQKIWPAKVSVVLPCPSPRFFYLHRGKKTLAFRLPAKKNLIALLKKTGPLAAPSANIEGLPPARNIKEARKYFGDKVDFYKRGSVSGQPSRIIKFQNGQMAVVRNA